MYATTVPAPRRRRACPHPPSRTVLVDTTPRREVHLCRICGRRIVRKVTYRQLSLDI